MEKILITGATGFVGGAIAKMLIEKYDPEELVCIHVASLNHDRLEYKGIDTGITWVQGNIEDYDFVSRVINRYEIDTIFHMAAEPIVRRASKNPVACFKVNIAGTWNLLEAARQSGTVTAFVGASSDKAYGVHTELPYKENFALNAEHTYDASKACADILIRTYAHNYGLNAMVVRSANIYGPGDFNFSRILPNSIRRLSQDMSPIIWEGVHNYVREFVHVEDVASACILLAEKAPALRGNAYNISSGDIWRVEDLVNHIAEEMEKNIRVSVVQKELSFIEIPEQYLDGSKLRAIGWEPKYKIAEGGLRDTINWFLGVFSDGVK